MLAVRGAASNPTRMRIYLNDHLAGATGGVALARRCLANNRGTGYEAFLADLLGRLHEDRQVLEGVIDRLGLRRSRGKVLAGLAVERVSRVKLNGQLRGYSPLSRVIEFEGLCAGVDAKRSMWRSLREVAADYPPLADFPFDEYLERASRQREELEVRRLDAARDAFAPRGSDEAATGVE